MSKNWSIVCSQNGNPRDIEERVFLERLGKRVKFCFDECATGHYECATEILRGLEALRLTARTLGRRVSQSLDDGIRQCELALIMGVE
jgi:hypothetical protein